MELEKGQPIGFFVVEPENLKFHHVPCKTKEKKNYKPKNKKADRRILNRF